MLDYLCWLQLYCPICAIDYVRGRVRARGAYGTSDTQSLILTANNFRAHRFAGVQATPLDLIPNQGTSAYRQYLNYPGSLTTEPCTEGVTWHVFTQPVAISADQLVRLLKEVRACCTRLRF